MATRNLLNPYPPEWSKTTPQRRLTIAVPGPDLTLIETVCPMHGTASALILWTIKLLADELRHQHITEYNPEAVASFLRRLASGSSTGHGPVADVARTEGSVCNAPQGTTSGEHTPRKGRTRGKRVKAEGV